MNIFGQILNGLLLIYEHASPDQRPVDKISEEYIFTLDTSKQVYLEHKGCNESFDDIKYLPITHMTMSYNYKNFRLCFLPLEKSDDSIKSGKSISSIIYDHNKKVINGANNWETNDLIEALKASNHNNLVNLILDLKTIKNDNDISIYHSPINSDKKHSYTKYANNTHLGYIYIISDKFAIGLELITFLKEDLYTFISNNKKAIENIDDESKQKLKQNLNLIGQKSLDSFLMKKKYNPIGSFIYKIIVRKNKKFQFTKSTIIERKKAFFKNKQRNIDYLLNDLGILNNNQRNIDSLMNNMEISKNNQSIRDFLSFLQLESILDHKKAIFKGQLSIISFCQIIDQFHLQILIIQDKNFNKEESKAICNSLKKQKNLKEIIIKDATIILPDAIILFNFQNLEKLQIDLINSNGNNFKLAIEIMQGADFIQELLFKSTHNSSVINSSFSSKSYESNIFKILDLNIEVLKQIENYRCLSVLELDSFILFEHSRKVLISILRKNNLKKLYLQNGKYMEGVALYTNDLVLNNKEDTSDEETNIDKYTIVNINQRVSLYIENLPNKRITFFGKLFYYIRTDKSVFFINVMDYTSCLKNRPKIESNEFVGSIHSLENLDVLNLSGNELASSLTSLVPKNIKELILSDCNLNESHLIANLKFFKSLKMINVSNNNLKDGELLKSLINDFNDLDFIDLSNIKENSINSKNIKKNALIKTLKLEQAFDEHSNNNILRSVLPRIANLEDLTADLLPEKKGLSYKHLKGLNRNLLLYLEKLKNLRIKKVADEGIIHNLLKSNLKLEIFEVSCNLDFTEHSRTFNEIKLYDLKEISLDTKRRFSCSFDGLANLSNLKVVKIMQDGKVEYSDDESVYSQSKEGWISYLLTTIFTNNVYSGDFNEKLLYSLGKIPNLEQLELMGIDGIEKYDGLLKIAGKIKSLSLVKCNIGFSQYLVNLLRVLSTNYDFYYLNLRANELSNDSIIKLKFLLNEIETLTVLKLE